MGLNIIRVWLILLVYGAGTSTGGAIESGANVWWYIAVALVSLVTVLVAVIAAIREGS